MQTVILKSKTKELITGSSLVEWRVVKASRNRYGELYMHTYLTTKDRALELIQKNGLVKAFRNEFGTVFDTPEGGFKSLFPDGLKSRDDIRKIESVDSNMYR